MAAMLLLACAHVDATSVRLKAPRDAAHLTLHIVVGPLPAGARLDVLLENGDVAGSIAPYGRAAATAGGSYDFPVPRSAVRDGAVTLLLQLQEKRDGAVRAPTKSEVKRLSLIASPD